MRSDHQNPDVYDENFSKSGESCKKAPSNMSDVAEPLFDLCLSSSASGLRNLI